MYKIVKQDWSNEKYLLITRVGKTYETEAEAKKHLPKSFNPAITFEVREIKNGN